MQTPSAHCVFASGRNSRSFASIRGCSSRESVSIRAHPPAGPKLLSEGWWLNPCRIGKYSQIKVNIGFQEKEHQTYIVKVRWPDLQTLPIELICSNFNQFEPFTKNCRKVQLAPTLR